MNKRKQRRVNTTISQPLDEFLRKYDAGTVAAILNSFESSPAWELFKVYVMTRQREFEVASLDMVKYGKSHEAAFASGYSAALNDVTSTMIKALKDLAYGTNPVIENPRPEESTL